MRIMFIVNDLGLNEPFGPMILSSVLKQKGHETALGALKKENVEEMIASFNPDILAYSMMSVDMLDMKKFNDALRKKKNIFTLLGGAHASLYPKCIDDPMIDAICVGEGDGAIVDVVDCIEKGKSLEGVPNILLSSDAPLNKRNLTEDLDSIPFMDRELVYSYPEMGNFGVKGIWASRGCPFPCPYCFNNRYNATFKDNGRIVRRRSVDSVIEETKRLVSKYRVDFIRIQDDVFVLKVDDWIKEFAEKFPSEIGIPYYALMRAESLTDEMAYYLKKSGCFSLAMSIETANDDIREKMLRRKGTKQHFEEAFKNAKKHKINVYANTMLAMPFTTLDHDIESLDFVMKVKPQMPNFSIFMPYPGTDLGDYCLDVGVYNPEKNPINYGMRNASPLNCFTKREINAQYNLCELGIIAVKFPRLRNLIVNRLIYWKPNKIFFFIHYLFSVTAYGRKVFSFKHSIKEYVELIIRTFKHYLYDFTKEEEKETINEIDGCLIVENKSRWASILSGRQFNETVNPAFDLEKRSVELEKCMDIMATKRAYLSKKVENSSQVIM